MNIKSILVITFLLGETSLLQCVAVKRPTPNNQKIYQQKFISSGNNFPDRFIAKDSHYLLLAALHNNDVESFVKKRAWSSAYFDAVVDSFKLKGLIREVDRKLYPTAMVINQEEGEQLYEMGQTLAQAIAELVMQHADTIKNRFQNSALSERHSFDSIAFFLYSNVLLDNWQINHVENFYLQAKRTERHGKNYYYALTEKGSTFRESFGIYGNQYNRIDNRPYIIYGNNRLRLDSHYIRQAYQHFSVFTKDDQRCLGELAAYFRPHLIRLLHSNHIVSNAVYEGTPYAKEVSFNEFFIWWYHFLYTRATNILAAKGYLRVPDEGNYYYVLKIE